MTTSSGRTFRSTATAMAVVAIATLVFVSGGTPLPLQGKAAMAQSGDRPNVLLIVTDDQRDLMGAMPKTRQYFQAEGRRYPNAFATTPMCCPSRGSIMTGMYAHNHGVEDNRIRPDFPFNKTLQAELQAENYRTAIFGKFLNGWALQNNPPNFDEWAVSNRGYERDGRPIQWNDQGTVGLDARYNTDVISDQAIDFIERAKTGDQPWLMYLTPFAPHEPYLPEPAYAKAAVPPYAGNPATRETDRSDKPLYIRNSTDSYSGPATLYGYFRGNGSKTRIAQYRTLHSVDDMVSDVFSALRRTGQTNTIAIFISDNGFMWGEHGYIGKTMPYTESIRVPMYIRWPVHIPAGTADRRLVGNIDVTPTILSLLGRPIDDRDGNDLLDPAWDRDRIHLEYWCIERGVKGCYPWASTRTRTAQYIESYDDAGNVTFREYYDLRTDPWQLSNQFRDSASAKTNPPWRLLRDQLRADQTCAGVTCP